MTATGDQDPFPLAAGFPAAAREDWLALVEKTLGGPAAARVLTRETYEGVRRQPLYTAADLAGAGPAPRPLRAAAGAVAKDTTGWDISQLHAHPDPAETARRIAEDLERGVTSVQLRLDPAGRNGVRVRSLDDLDHALAPVALDRVPVQLQAGADAPAAALLLMALWERRGVAPGSARGGFGLDPLGALAVSGHLPGVLEDALAWLGRLAAHNAQAAPGVRAVTVDAGPCHEAGGSEVQDLACAMATALAYLRAMRAAGMTADAACRQIGFRFAVGVDLFPTIAKLRAARRLWARIAGVCGASPAAAAMALQAQTAERGIAARDVWVNMPRAALACFAAVAGGADAVTILPHDHALGPPDGLARRVARNTQLILMRESALARVADPAGGSWYAESLTGQYADAAWALFQRIEAEGGMAVALAQGMVQAMVAESWEKRARNIARRRDPLTGVSTYPHLGEAPVAAPVAPNPPAPSAGPPLVPAVPAAAGVEAWIAAALAGADAAAIARALAGAGAPARIRPLSPHRLGEGFEALRAASDRFLARTGARPAALLATLGRPADYAARAAFARNYMEAGGIEACPVELDMGGAGAGAALRASGGALAVICASDSIYAEAAIPVAAALRAEGARRVILAGRPGDREEAYRGAGIDGFIHAGDDALAVLRALAVELGVIEA